MPRAGLPHGRRTVTALGLASLLVAPVPGFAQAPADATLTSARADIARGRYAEALTVLAGPAGRDPGGDAALELGLLQHYLGRREAERTLGAVVARNSDGPAPARLLRAGRAARALGRFEEANGLFRDANRIAPADVAVNTAWGELFQEKYSQAEAAKSFKAALDVNPKHVPAQIGMARVLADSNPPEARKAAEAILAAEPGHVDALLLIAEIELGDSKRAEARALIGRALAANPNSLEARALDAALLYVDDRTADFEKAVAGVLAINPRYADVYRIAGEHAARAYRFEEAVALTRRALALDPDSSRALAMLGMHLLRTGDEPGARKALDAAFKLDPYDVVTFNSLALLDTLDTFVTVTDGDLVFRFHPDEAAVMREHALPLAKEAVAALSRTWQFTPKGPLLIEMFPKHDDFAVRTIGLPGFIGALGACFGQVVTLDSPKARPPGEFNWGATLWHELAHVITVQLSGQRVPRWLTEGISVFEEKRARREWGREQELEFAHALDHGGVMTLKNLNAGFSDPKTISMAYFQASQVVAHIHEAYGQPKLRALVEAYATGVDTDGALKAALGITMDDLQKGFDAYTAREFGALRSAMKAPETLAKTTTLDGLKALADQHPGSFPVLMRLADAYERAGEAASAIATYERAAKLAPPATGKDSPNVRIAALAVAAKQPDRALAALDALAQVDANDIESARTRAGLVAARGDTKRTMAAYARVASIDPFDVDAQLSLGNAALASGDAATAIRAFRSVLAAGTVDKAAARTRLAEAYAANGQKADAKKEVLAALELAPQYERAQDLLLKLAQP
ncbi:MAG: tetratricopeptide repeat protein [Alphaproteobacteria bacterium]